MLQVENDSFCGQQWPTGLQTCVDLKFALASPEIKKHVWVFSAQKPVIWSHMLKYIVKQLCFEISLRKPNAATDILQLFFKPQFSLCNVQINTDLARVILDPSIL